MNILQVKNLNIGYRLPLLTQLNFDLNQGERLVIFGANGSGKSTLLKSLTQPALRLKGEVHWNIRMHEISPLHQDPTFNSRTPDLVEDYLIKSQLLFSPLKLRNKKLVIRVQGVMEKLSLKNLPLHVLSGGQRQKLKLGRALLNNSKALLLDEPMNAVDSKSKIEIFSILRTLSPSTVQIWVLHDFFEIQQVQSPILWIQEGQTQLYDFKSWFKKVDQEFHSWMRPEIGAGSWNQI